MLTKQLSTPFGKQLSLNTWRTLYLLIALLIAIRVMANQHGWVNNDSLLYFEQARLLAANDWQAAFALFQWPFYAGLIALTHTLSGLDIHTSAQCLNAVFFVLFVAGFQQLLLVSGAKTRTLHWGMALLFSTTYLVGDILGMLLRDEGFWAAFTWGLFYWCKHSETQQVKHTLLFQACMVIATLFRVEAIAYLAAVPLLVFFNSAMSIRQKLCRWMINSLFMIAGLIGLLSAVLLGGLQAKQLGRLQEVFSQISGVFTYRLDAMSAKASILGQQVLGTYLDDYAHISLWSTLLLIILLKTAKVTGYPTLLLLLWPKRQWWSSIHPAMQQLAPFVLITGFVVSIVIILNTFVLSSRYVIASGIVMLCMAAFAMSYLERGWARWVKYAVITLLTLMVLNNIRDRDDIDLDRMAVNAVSNIHTIQTSVFYDTENARFYAHQPFMNRIDGYNRLKQVEKAGQIDQFDIYVITPHHDTPAYEEYALPLLEKHHFIIQDILYGWRKRSKAYILIKKDIAEAQQITRP
jgi:hypothetical protein